MLKEGRAYRVRTGKSLMVPRYDIVLIPDHVRENLERQRVRMLAPNSVEVFPAETAQSMFDFRTEDVVGQISPRPLLLVHPRQKFRNADRAVDRDVLKRTG